MPTVRVIANAHYAGGGEMSTVQICRLLSERGDTVTFYPTGKVDRRLQFDPAVRMGRPYETEQPRRSALPAGRPLVGELLGP